MVEKAFKVKHGSGFEKMYFAAKAERKTFNEAATAFSKAHGLEMNRYIQSRQLETSMTDEERERFANQICKTPGKSGLTKFKAKSEMNRLWVEEVVSKCTMKAVNDLSWWQFMRCDVKSGGCSSSLWSYNGTVYGYLADKYADDTEKDAVKLCDDMEEIKMSEYYAVIEETEKEEN